MPPLTLHNTLHNQRQPFTPLDAAHVRMYVCGPTVYGPVHVGNARPAVIFDLLYRLLRHRHPKVTYARNITDIDDKIIAAATRAGIPPQALAAQWKTAYKQDMTRLGVLPPDAEPTATDSIPAIVAMIKRLIDRGHAYAAEDHVLFHVPSHPPYGELSNRRREDMLAGARVEIAPYKRDPADFVLWKPSVPPHPGWPSPWGRGRPGWHIECSAMAAECLGEQIDIHGGGQDLIFPHHENELAQSRCAHGAPRFAKFWLHNGHVRMDGDKMSKSRGNVLLLRDALTHYPGEAIRLALLSAHYRQPLNWTQKLLDDAKATLDKWYRTLAPLPPAPQDTQDTPQDIESALLDDLNTPAAIAALHGKTRHPPALAAGAKQLGLLRHSPHHWFQGTPTPATPTTPNESIIEKKIAARLRARRAGDYATADAIRDQLAEMNIVLEDTATDTKWRKK